MKILLLQLTRLGDIFTTWPVVRALKRKYPEAEITMMVRKRFAQACVGLEDLDEVVYLETDSILEPLLDNSIDVEGSLSRLNRWLGQLQGREYDKIINLSFSPSSSFITHLIAGENTEVRGYSRFEDQVLNITDGVSAYFYSQVGLKRKNKIHTADLMAGVADVELVESDWRPPNHSTYLGLKKPYIVVHVGASQEGKSYSPDLWSQALSEIEAWWSGHIYLIGSRNEVVKADAIQWSMQSNRVTSLVDKTEIPDLFSVVGSSSLLIGCDSSPVHVASLTGTPTLNLSFSAVNFWETGPKAPKSIILWAVQPDLLEPSKVSREARRIIENQPTREGVAEVEGPLSVYREVQKVDDDFQWNLISYIYFSAPWPTQVRADIEMAIAKLIEVNDLAIEQTMLLSANPKSQTSSLILDRVDEMFNVIAELVPDMGPLVRWAQTEKSRIAPGPFSQILEETYKVHLGFARLLSGSRTQEAHP